MFTEFGNFARYSANFARYSANVTSIDTYAFRFNGKLAELHLPGNAIPTLPDTTTIPPARHSKSLSPTTSSPRTKPPLTGPSTPPKSSAKQNGPPRNYTHKRVGYSAI